MMRRAEKFLGKNRKLIAALLFAVIVFYAVHFYRMTIVAGPEGVRASHHALQFGLHDQLRLAAKADQLPPYFKWVDNSPSNMIVRREKMPGEPWGGFVLHGPGWWYDCDSGEIRSEIQRPLLLDDPVGFKYRTLTYYKYTPLSPTSVEIRKIVAEIVPVDFVIQISAVPGRGVYTWENVAVWFMVDTVTWQNAYVRSPPKDPDPLTNATVKHLASNYRGAFPIIAWVGEYKSWVFRDEAGNIRESPPTPGAVSHVQLSPDLKGRFIDLYIRPGTQYTLVTNEMVLADPEAALQPTWLPDPRFAETVYFKITLLSFGAYVQPTGIWGSYSSFTVWYPSVFYRLRCVYAVYGEHVYLWTKSEAEHVGYTDWQLRETQRDEYLDPFTAFFRSIAEGIADWFRNPWNLLGLGLFALLAIALVTVIVLYWFTGWRRR